MSLPPKVHSQKIMDVSYVQVSDKDGYMSRSNTITSRSGDVPDHKENHPGEDLLGEDLPRNRVHQDSAESVH